jgi:hypothetical protein
MEDTKETFMALVDAIIPRTPELAKKYGEYMEYGALDQDTDEYNIMLLNRLYVPMANLIAELLDVLANQLMFVDNKSNQLNLSNRGAFGRLNPVDRFRAMLLAEQLELEESELLIPFLNYPGVINLLTAQTRFTDLGYYSEWFGYGTTKFKEPNQRVLEFKPNSWQQVGYPGRSFSYINDVREYYKIRNERENLQ